jgi:hypothetical protein
VAALLSGGGGVCWSRRRGCSEPLKLDRFWLEFSAPIPRLGGAENDEGLEVFGRPERPLSAARFLPFSGDRAKQNREAKMARRQTETNYLKEGLAWLKQYWTD